MNLKENDELFSRQRSTFFLPPNPNRDFPLSPCLSDPKYPLVTFLSSLSRLPSSQCLAHPANTRKRVNAFNDHPPLPSSSSFFPPLYAEFLRAPRLKKRRYDYDDDSQLDEEAILAAADVGGEDYFDGDDGLEDLSDDPDAGAVEDDEDSDYTLDRTERRHLRRQTRRSPPPGEGTGRRGGRLPATCTFPDVF